MFKLLKFFIWTFFIFSHLMRFSYAENQFINNTLDDFYEISTTSLEEDLRIQFINSAKKTIQLIVFDFQTNAFTSSNEKDKITDRIKNALVQAKKRGVSVKVITSWTASLFDEGLSKLYHSKINVELKSHGIEHIEAGGLVSIFLKGYPIFNTNHEKYLIIDQEKAIVSSRNFAQMYENWLEGGQVIKNKSLIQKLSKIFESTFETQKKTNALPLTETCKTAMNLTSSTMSYCKNTTAEFMHTCKNFITRQSAPSRVLQLEELPESESIDDCSILSSLEITHSEEIVHPELIFNSNEGSSNQLEIEKINRWIEHKSIDASDSIQTQIIHHDIYTQKGAQPLGIPVPLPWFYNYLKPIEDPVIHRLIEILKEATEVYMYALVITPASLLKETLIKRLKDTQNPLKLTILSNSKESHTQAFAHKFPPYLASVGWLIGVQDMHDLVQAGAKIYVNDLNDSFSFVHKKEVILKTQTHFHILDGSHNTLSSSCASNTEIMLEKKIPLGTEPEKLANEKINLFKDILLNKTPLQSDFLTGEIKSLDRLKNSKLFQDFFKAAY